MNHPSRGLIGRHRELAEADLALAVAASGTPQVLLVGGDAGIGKTTLTVAIADHAYELGFTVLLGHCLDIDDGVALRPVREALRGVLRGRTDKELPHVTRRLAPYLRGDADDVTIDELALVVEEGAGAGPLLLVLEDMHWADQSTVDLATAVARTGHGSMCLVLTYRSDEIPLGSPFRKAVVDLGRSPGTSRVDLVALGREEVAALATRRSGAVDPALIDVVFERSEGNPLYAEELIAAGIDDLPEALAALLLRRVDGLSEPTRLLLKLASVHGSTLSPRVLAQGLGLEALAVDAALREAIEGYVLERAGDQVRFRHGLIREAVYDDLMPGERTLCHTRVAEAIERLTGDDPGMTELGQLAFHWHAAHDVPRAFAAAVRAGTAARRHGLPEAIPFLTRALELFDRVPPEDREPAEADLVLQLALAHHENYGPARSRELMAQALDLVSDESDPLSAARVYTAYAQTWTEIEGGLTHKEALDRALSLLGDEPSAELASALTMQSFWFIRYEQWRAASMSAGEAVTIARALGLAEAEGEALYNVAWAAMALGDHVTSAEKFREGASLQHRGGAHALAYLAEAGQAEALLAAGDHESGMRIAESARDRALRDGFPYAAARIRLERVQGLLDLGRLTDADLELDALAAERSVPDDSFDKLAPRIRLLLFRGDAATAEPLVRTVFDKMRSIAALPTNLAVLPFVQVLVATNQVDEAVATMREVLARFENADGPVSLGAHAYGAYHAIEAAHRRGLPDPTDLMEMADGALNRALRTVSPTGSRTRFGCLIPQAHALRAELCGEPSTDLWRAAYDAAAHVGAGLALPVRLRLLRAMLAEGVRDEARTALSQVVNDARTTGMEGVLEDALKLARRHRIPVAGDERPSILDILTTREREVLEVLVTGATNRAIADKLFISEKTVSVHVTNLLAKLRVTNRTEAAAVARDLAP